MVGTPKRGCLSQFKSRRRSIFNRPQEVIAKTTNNNRDLIDALEKCKTSRANSDRNRLEMVAQNLKFMEQITFLKEDKKALERENTALRKENKKLQNDKAAFNATSEQNIVKVLQKLLCVHLQSMPTSQYDSPKSEVLKSVMTPEDDLNYEHAVPESMLTPESDSECFTRVKGSTMFDAVCQSRGASPIVVVKAQEKVCTEDSPIFEENTPETTPKNTPHDITLLSPNDTPDLCIIEEDSIDSGSPENTNDDVKENIPLDKGEKTETGKKKLARTKCVTPQQSNDFIRPRETPSRRSKSDVNYTEPSSGVKLRRGDRYTDNFSMKYIKNASSRL